MLDSLKYDRATHPNTGFVANLLIEASSTYKWCFDFFSKAREDVQTGLTTEAECLSRFTGAVSAKLPRQGPFKVQPGTVDWPALFNFIEEATFSQTPGAWQPSRRLRAPSTPPPPQDYSWDDLLPILDKWKHIADLPQVLQLCRTKSKVTAGTLLRLLRQNVQKGTISTDLKESRKRGAGLGSAVASTMIGSFTVGLEYAQRNSARQLSSNDIAALKTEAMPLLRAAITPAVEWGVGLAHLLSKSGELSSRDYEETIVRLAKIVLKDSLECFQAGLQHRSAS